MVDPMRSVRIADDVWVKAKRDALDHGLTLQEWLTLLILQGKQRDNEELHIVGEGIKR